MEQKNIKCTKCQITKPITDFSIRKVGTTDKLRKRCKECCDIKDRMCLGCNILLPVSEFFKSKDTYKARCKKCCYEQNKTYLTEEFKENRRDYMKHYMRKIYATANNNSKK